MARSRTTFAILGFLAQHPMSGYDIKKRVEGSIDNFWSESFGQIYPSLRRLADQGQIDKRSEKSDGGRPRHVYSIRAAGRRALARWLAEPTDAPPVRIELLLKIFFGAESDNETSRKQIRAYRDQMSRDLERYRSIARGLADQDSASEHLPYWEMTLRFGVRDREAHVEWCDEALELLEQLPEGTNPGGREGRKAL